jgi:hypothetical protein
MFFLSSRFSRLRSATSSFSAKASARRSFTSPVDRRENDPPDRFLILLTPGGPCHRPAASCQPRGIPLTANARIRLPGSASTSCHTGFGPSSGQQSPGLLADPPPPSLRHNSAMLSSPPRPDSTIRIFSSDECNLRPSHRYCVSIAGQRYARRMSFTTFSAGAFVVTGFFLISTSMWGQDEPQILRYAIMLNCSMGADGGHGAREGTYDHRLACLADPSKASVRHQRDAELCPQIQRVWNENYQVYGGPQGVA